MIELLIGSTDDLLKSAGEKLWDSLDDDEKKSIKDSLYDQLYDELQSYGAIDSAIDKIVSAATNDAESVVREEIDNYLTEDKVFEIVEDTLHETVRDSVDRLGVEAVQSRLGNLKVETPSTIAENTKDITLAHSVNSVEEVARIARRLAVPYTMSVDREGLGLRVRVTVESSKAQEASYSSFWMRYESPLDPPYTRGDLVKLGELKWVIELNVPNRTLVIMRDNLDFLRALNNESVHLIATDPPFKKNRDLSRNP